MYVHPNMQAPLAKGQRVLVRITRITLSGTPRFMSLHATSFWYCVCVISPMFLGGLVDRK
jgi:hypothetical protein